MPRTKRAPIDYVPQFGGGIFRSPETVEEELAELGQIPGRDVEARAVEDGDGDHPLRDQGGGKKSTKRLTGTPGETPTGRTNQWENERTNERTRVRHSFDVWQDQLLGLTEIQVERFNRTGRKPKLGELVQEALDAYIDQQCERTDERTNRR